MEHRQHRVYGLAALLQPGHHARPCAALACRLAWVSMAPLGSPVVPDVYWRTARSRAAGRGCFFLSPPASRSCRHGSTGRTAGAGRPFSSPLPTVKAARALRAAGTRGGTTDQLSELTVAGAGAEELKGGLGTVAAHGLVHEVHQRTLRQDQIRRNTRPVGIRPWELTPWLPRLRCRAPSRRRATSAWSYASSVLAAGICRS